MSPMRIIILLVAALAAAGAAFLVRNMSTQAPPPPPQPAAPVQPAPVQEVVEAPTTPVLVVTRNVKVGEMLTPADLDWTEWPDEQLNASFFTQDVTPEAVGEVSQSVVRTAMFENEPVLPGKIVKKGETGYMAALLEPGMRAVTVEISTVTASGGFILPGDRVDVLLSYDVELEQGDRDRRDQQRNRVTRPTTTVLMENVRILAIDQVFGDAQGTFAIGSTATVELPPREARLLIMAKRLGKVSLALRSARDANEGGPVAARTDFLLDVSPYGDADSNAGALNNRVTVYRSGEVSIEMPSGS